MPQGYFHDLRERLLQAAASGVPIVEIARTIGVSVRSISRWKHSQRTEMSLAPGVSSGRPRKIASEDEDVLRTQVSVAGCHVGGTVCPVDEQWACHGERFHNVSDPYPLQSLTQKKTLIATERDEEARAAWRTEMAGIDPATLVFLYETSTQTVMIRRYGRAPRGERVVGQVPRNHGPNVTCLVAIGATGAYAPCVFEGTLDSMLFVRWVTDWLVPTLSPGTTVVLDKLNVHKTAAARMAIEAAGCQLCFLPTYSPDFNPIELALSKLKTHLRGIETRTFEPLVDAIGVGLTAITITDIAGWYRHCGYLLTGQPL